jgi:hypothetical protein
MTTSGAGGGADAEREQGAAQRVRCGGPVLHLLGPMMMMMMIITMMMVMIMIMVTSGAGGGADAGREQGAAQRVRCGGPVLHLLGLYGPTRVRGAGGALGVSAGTDEIRYCGVKNVYGTQTSEVPQ